MGFVKNWGQLVGTRVLLGILEAGYFPGSVYLLSCWYTRYDVQKRFSIFYLIGCVASALAGILAFGLMQLDGAHGLTGWRWIFILEGVVSLFLLLEVLLALTLVTDYRDYWTSLFCFLSGFPRSRREIMALLERA